jgi:protein gp37
VSAITDIAWCHHTHNGWWGCTEVSEACDNCYARGIVARFAAGNWGRKGRRRFFNDEYWAQPKKWNAAAKREGRRHRVFAYSMGDWAEELPAGHPDEEMMRATLERLWETIEATPSLDWLLLTKRADRIRLHEPFAGESIRFPNVWLGTTVESDKRVSRLHDLLQAPASVRFVSAEPLRSSLMAMAPYIGGYLLQTNDGRWLRNGTRDEMRSASGTWRRGLDWVIAGAELAGKATPSDPTWFRELRDRCAAEGVPFFFKQWGSWAPLGALPKRVSALLRRRVEVGETTMVRITKKHDPRRLDGVLHEAFPRQVRCA